MSPYPARRRFFVDDRPLRAAGAWEIRQRGQSGCHPRRAKATKARSAPRQGRLSRGRIESRQIEKRVSDPVATFSQIATIVRNASASLSDQLL